MLHAEQVQCKNIIDAPPKPREEPRFKRKLIVYECGHFSYALEEDKNIYLQMYAVVFSSFFLYASSVCFFSFPLPFDHHKSFSCFSNVNNLITFTRHTNTQPE